jgi:CheY-like chemotaxis protein
VSWVISLVEDDDAIREHLAEVLRARGLQVVEARHGAEALELVRRRGIRPALMVLDLMMPVMDGRALLDAQPAEPLLDGVPVVVITAHDPVGPLPATVHAVLKKPFALNTLLETVRHLCSDLDPPSRPIARGSPGLDRPLATDDPDDDKP